VNGVGLSSRVDSTNVIGVLIEIPVVQRRLDETVEDGRAKKNPSRISPGGV
jgi:hypothetical protein